MSVETSIELQEFHGGGGQRGMTPALTTASWRAAVSARGLENSLQDQPPQLESMSASAPSDSKASRDVTMLLEINWFIEHVQSWGGGG